MEKEIKVGDLLKVPAVLSGCEEDQFVEVVGLYRNFFNVRYNWGFQQSFRYDDLGKLVII